MMKLVEFEQCNWEGSKTGAFGFSLMIFEIDFICSRLRTSDKMGRDYLLDTLGHLTCTKIVIGLNRLK